MKLRHTYTYASPSFTYMQLINNNKLLVIQRRNIYRRTRGARVLVPQSQWCCGLCRWSEVYIESVQFVSAYSAVCVVYQVFYTYEIIIISVSVFSFLLFSCFSRHILLFFCLYSHFVVVLASEPLLWFFFVFYFS